MKKLLLVLTLLLGFFPMILMVSADTYSPHYLPGGKNYLSTDNFTYSNGVLSSNDNFAIKAHTYYTLSFPRDFYDPGEISWTISYYENDNEIDFLSHDSYDLFVHSSEPYYGSFTFQTPTNANYIAITINDNNDYLLTHNVNGLILEEGLSFTSYEPFVIGNLIDINGPYYNGSGVVIVNIDNPFTLAEITSGLSAYDAIEGDVSSNIIVVNDTYTTNLSTVGEYLVEYSVSDSSGNVTYFNILVKVVDVTKPIISGNNTIVLSYPNTLTIDAIKSQLNASDNVDGDISSSIELVEENYTLNQSILGFYEITFKVTDSSNNTTFYMVEIEVIDEASPIFSGPESFVIGYNAILTVQDVIASQTVMDDYDQNLTTSITIKTDLYTPNMKKIGTYPIVLTVSDSSGNIQDKTISVQITDVIGPVVYLDTSVIMVYNNTILGLSDFTQLLINSGELSSTEAYEVFVIFDSYTARSTQKGVYHISLDFKNKSGETELSKTLEIVVREKSPDFDYELPDIDFSGEQSEQKFILRYWHYLALGGIFIIALISNIIWFVMYKKR
ncbi:MAG: hypothetical protein CVV56_07315 [Tenericutes bacterium HGW-Tenericutes-1]|nr:MAG: hypothetical protein CVV56_07315 [Tenericutes bacterium HGW-Tenericutes-1]